MTLAESPHDANVLWAGADDGMVNVTFDGGNNWKNVSPGPEGIINSIEVSPHDAQTVYITVMRYKFNDMQPYIYKSVNGGQSWSKVIQGIPDGAYARVVREDPDRKGLLYAGTERGVYISFDAGTSWKELKLNLPMVPITDLMVHKKDLLAATHGRAFWILDDLTPLHQLNSQVAASSTFLYKPRDIINAQSFGTSNNPAIGKNPNPGAAINYYLKEIDKDDSIALTIDIKDADGNLLRSFSSDHEDKSSQMPRQPGMNVLFWDLNTANIKVSEGVMPAGPGRELEGYNVGPGSYTVSLTHGSYTQDQTFDVLPDPRDGLSAAVIAQKMDIVKNLYKEVVALYKGLDDLQEVRKQIKNMTDRLPNDEEINEMGNSINESIDEVENELISPKQETFQDIINYRNKLDLQLYNLMQTINFNIPPVTEGEKALAKELLEKWDAVDGKLSKVLNEDIGEFNQLLRDKGIQYIAPTEKEDKKEKDKAL